MAEQSLKRSYLHDGSAIVSNGLLAVLVHHQQVATVRTQGRLDGRLNRQTSIDVGDDLSFALGSVGSCGFLRQSSTCPPSYISLGGGGVKRTFLEDDNRGRLAPERHFDVVKETRRSLDRLVSVVVSFFLRATCAVERRRSSFVVSWSELGQLQKIVAAFRSDVPLPTSCTDHLLLLQGPTIRIQLQHLTWLLVIEPII